MRSLQSYIARHSYHFNSSLQLDGYGFTCDCRACEEDWPLWDEIPGFDPDVKRLRLLCLAFGAYVIMCGGGFTSLPMDAM